MNSIKYTDSARGGYNATVTTKKGNERIIHVEKALGWAALPWTATYGGRGAHGVTRDDAVKTLMRTMGWR